MGNIILPTPWDSRKKLKRAEDEIKYIPNAPDIVQRVTTFSTDEAKRQAYAAGIFDAMNEKGDVTTLERRTEREKLYTLLDKIVGSSGGKYNNRDEVFDVLAKANFSGNYMPAARMIEGILGKGSFRKIAEDFSEKPL